jgi:hypothetical protein
MAILLFSLTVSATIGFLLVSILRVKFDLFPGLKLCLAIGAGYGVSSCLYFAWLVLFGRSNSDFIFTELLILIILIIYYYYLRAYKHSKFMGSYSNNNFSLSQPTSNIYKPLLYGFYCVTTFCLATFLLMSHLLPHGGWDAWQTWNLFARFIYRGGEHWRNAFTPLLASHHPDYPLLIPTLVSRSWQYMGAESQLAPVFIALSFCFATIWLLVSTLYAAKSRNHGYLAGIILMGTVCFVVLASYQYADVPLAFYYLAALSLLVLQDIEPDNHGISLLAGVMAGFACWTKNEGFLFLAAIIAARLIQIFVQIDKKANFIRLCYMAAGSSIILAVVFYFKYEMAPMVDLFVKQNMNSIIDKISDPSRYLVVVSAFFKTTLHEIPMFFLLVIYPLYSGISIDPKMKGSLLTIFLTVIFMGGGYLAIYIITPYDLQWHLKTSLSRLLMQLWPSFILAVFLMTRSSEAVSRGRNE